MYENIGKKIKGLAVWMFIVDAIGGIITGIVLAAEEGIFILISIGAPIVAWISSWLLYGFGELIDACYDNKINTSKILDIISQPIKIANSQQAQNEVTTHQKTNSVKKEETSSYDIKVDTYEIVNDSTIKCANCGTEQNKNRVVCWNCGKPFVPYYCANCKHLGPYTGNCPSCNSSIKIYVNEKTV